MSEQAREHDGLQHAADKVQDALGGMVGKVTAKMVSDADSFVENAAISDMYELEAARVVLARSPSRQVKEVAKTMIADHTASSNQLKAALEMSETNGVAAPPRSLDKRRQKMLEHLEAAPDDKLEQVYVEQQVLAHEEALALLQGYERKGDNAQLRSFAADTAPVVDRHLKRARELKSELGD